MWRASQKNRDRNKEFIEKWKVPPDVITFAKTKLNLIKHSLCAFLNLQCRAVGPKQQQQQYSCWWKKWNSDCWAKKLRLLGWDLRTEYYRKGSCMKIASKKMCPWVLSQSLSCKRKGEDCRPTGNRRQSPNLCV